MLVSAAAGSGKTATLTERVLRAVMSDDPRADIRRMLIVTYTNKAAAELRTKVRKKLEEKLNAEPDNANIRRQLNLLPSADICTIHSFYIKLLQKNFAALGLPPKIGIGDDSEFMQIKKSLCNELIEAYYEGDVKGEYEIEDPASFFALFSGDKTDEDLWETFTEFYSKASSYREFLEFYNNCAKEAAEAAENFSASRYYRYIRSYVVRILILYRDKILSLCDKYLDDEQFAEKYHPVFESCIAEIERAVSAYKTLGYKDAAAYSVIKPTFPKFPRVTDEPEFKKPSQDLKDELKPKLFNVIERIYSFSEEQTAEICRNTAKVYSDLYKFLSNFDRLYTEKKLKIKKLGYDDLERYACRLLCGKDGKPTKEAIETGKRYDRIFIDEYQDVNSTQDAIFAAISHNDRFMVGDIKQSIYGFRGAEPAIFAEYRKNAENEDNKGKVPDVLFLADNFRCGKPVVDYTNFIFKKLFGADTDEIPYSDEESLVFSKTADDREDVKVRIHISVGENRSEDEKEYIADISEKRRGYQNNKRSQKRKSRDFGKERHFFEICKYF